MIVVGALMAMAAGSAIASHVLPFGGILNLFIAHDIALQLLNGTSDTIALGIFLEMFNTTNATGGMTMEYFCNVTESSTSATIAEFLNSSDPGSLLQSKIYLYSLYYVGLASVVLIASFFATLFWNLSAYRQTRCLQQAFFRSIMKQEIGWFDVNPSTQLNSRLSE